VVNVVVASAVAGGDDYHDYNQAFVPWLAVGGASKLCVFCGGPVLFFFFLLRQV